jgi:hAT family C-terminal dimerisation region
MAYDFLSIPVMSAETERMFSNTQIFLSRRQRRMGADVLAALECENRWIKAGIWLAQRYRQGIDASELATAR